ncbi:ATP-binding protein [Flammeovirgaceae bacterium SG7u.111]|nr:ATP-binding protein [Flammeovirgaceae bacterium SG7u.132]WPO34960.1 ATP-binding protein [Flammeovirgaceae bacterium SG7u.111]
MNLNDVKKLAGMGEGLQVEFKRKVADPLKVLREVVAFANRKGGYLLIGVDDDGSVLGLKHAEDDEFAMQEVIDKHCSPIIDYQLERVKVTAKRDVLVFKIKESIQKPVFLIYNLKRKIGRAYIRVEDKSVQTSREVRKVLKGQTKNQDNLVKYGEVEQSLLRCFHRTQTLNMRYLAENTSIKPHEASDVLVKLTLANVLEVHPSDNGDLYTMKGEPPVGRGQDTPRRLFI